MNLSRRNFFRLSGTGLLASQFSTVLNARESLRKENQMNKSGIPFDLGVASYTFREFSLEETIAMTAKLNIRNLCLKSMHLPLDLSEEEIENRASLVRKAGLSLYAGGVIYMQNADEVENAFAYASHAGMDLIVGDPDQEFLEMCNQKVKDTGIRLAIHNHGPDNARYPSPESIYTLIKDMDPGMGLCVDIGHTARLGLDPIAETRKFMDRVHDIHIKDEDKAEASGNTCEIGRGVIDIPGFLQMLVEENYSEIVSFEYEKDGSDPLAGLAESVGYVRGVLNLLS